MGGSNRSCEEVPARCALESATLGPEHRFEPEGRPDLGSGPIKGIPKAGLA